MRIRRRRVSSVSSQAIKGRRSSGDSVASRSRQFSRFEQLEDRMLLAADLRGVSWDFLDTADLSALVAPAPAVGGGGIVNGSSTSEHPSVGNLNNNCTATLIGPRHVLTAAHCVEDLAPQASSFFVGGAWRQAVNTTIHPNYDPDDFSAGWDLAVIELTQDVIDVTPSDILRTPPVTGEMMTLVGYGYGGTTNNPNFSSLKRVGQTPLEQVTSNHLLWTFNGNGESNTASGDSGGPSFVEREGELVVAGVTSGGTGSAWAPGSLSFNTRIDNLQTWIDDIVNFVPEPDDFSDIIGPTSTPITSAGEDGWILGGIQQAGDRDGFNFTVPVAAEVTLSMVATGAAFDTHLRLHDSSGALIATGDDIAPGNTNSRVVMNLEAGLYYFTAGSFQDAGRGDYAVAVDFVPNSVSRPARSHARRSRHLDST